MADVKKYEAPDAQVVSFENDYVATTEGGGDASAAGLLHMIGGSCTYSTGDHLFYGCGSSSRPAS